METAAKPSKMSRQVDVKAIVSHIVRGDGADKCRICMGDTSEGQVFLGDSVLLDGNRAVTLAELLETITGVEVPVDDNLPTGLCSICTVAAMDAGNTIYFFRDAADCWARTLQLLENLPEPGDIPKQNKLLKVVLGKNDLTIESYPEENPNSEPEYYDCDDTVFYKKRKRKRSKRGKFSCSDCEKPFEYLKDLSNHFLQSSDLRRTCDECASVMHRDELVQHMRQVHDEKVFPCKKCPAILYSLPEALRHLGKYHFKGSHTCADCGISFKSITSLNAHAPIHQPRTCPNCDKTFRNKSCYVYHAKICCDLNSNREDMHRTKTRVTVEVKNVKTKRKIQVGMRGSADTECYCDYCGKKFSGKKFVAAHIHIVHTKMTHQPCPYCGKLMAAAHLGSHIKRHELQEFKCDLCGMVLRSKLGYQQHIRLHTGELPYECAECGERFPASSRRSEHMRKVHRTKEVVLRHACELCPAKFLLPYKLRKHMTTTHPAAAAGNQRPEFQCDICFVKFGSCRGLVHHSKKHQTTVKKQLKEN